MSTLKARFEDDAARELLGRIHPHATDLTALAGGEASRAYGFRSNGQDLVLRVNHHASYARDAAVSRRFRQVAVPVPQILQFGRHGSHFWAISERALGILLEGLDAGQHMSLMDAMATTMIAIHRTPIEDTSGYGLITESGNAAHATWRDFLTGDGMYGAFVDWKRMLPRADLRQRRLVEDAWAAAARLTDGCPEERAIVHGDYTYDNLLTDGESITGVIDWNVSLYGDRLWDVAWTDLWCPDITFAAAYLHAFPAEGSTRRLLCYQLLIAAQAIGFYLQTGQPEKNPWIAAQLEPRLRAAQSLLAGQQP